MAPQTGFEGYLERAVAQAGIEPWMELESRLQEHYRLWGFSPKDLPVSGDMRVSDLWEVTKRFHQRHPEAYAEVTVFDPTFIRIVRTPRVRPIMRF